MAEVAYILFGRGSDLGSFGVFARSLQEELRGRFHNNVYVLQAERRSVFFDAIEHPAFRDPTDRIGELHVFSHAIGGGLFLGYHDGSLARVRESARLSAATRGLRLSYSEVLMNEGGTVFTDVLVRPPWTLRRNTIRTNFAPNATIKLWGCNSGVTGWVYSDTVEVAPGVRRDVVSAWEGDIYDYYWRALNEQNMPKPSIAQAFADYFDRTTYGAHSGSHIEVFDHGHWLKSSDYRRSHGRWPPPSRMHRLAPDVGSYRAHHPARRAVHASP
jgi:hypothetical protein